MQRTLEMEPRLYLANAFLGLACVALGKYEAAQDAYARAIGVAGRTPFVLRAMGALHARLSEREQALRTLDELRDLSAHRYVRPTYTAAVHAAMGNREAALAALQAALAERDTFLPSIRDDPAFDPLRADPRFGALLRQIGPAKPR